MAYTVFVSAVLSLLVIVGAFSLIPDGSPVEVVTESVVVFSSPDYSGLGVYDGSSCRLYNGYVDYGKVVVSLE